MSIRPFRRCLAFVVCCGAVSSPLRAASSDFDFKDPKGVNTISFLLDSPLEPILGITSGIVGNLKFDPAAPTTTSGKFEVDAKSLHIENKGMQDTLLGKDWLDVEQFPKIEFAFKQIKDAKTVEPNVFDLTVVGAMTCKGVTKDLTVSVRASYMEGKLGERLRGKEGDLLVLRSKFSIKRSDFNIKPGGTQIVADDIQLSVSIVGSAFKK